MIQALQKLTATGDQLYAKVCTVHHVDKENKRCDVVPVDGSAELFDIPFQADVQGTGLCFYPAKDSKVLVVFTNKHHACICNVSEVDLMKLVIDKMEFSVDKERFVIKNEGVQFAVSNDGFLLKKEDETLKKLMDDLFKEIQAMIFTTPQGPTTTLKNAAEFKAIQTRFNNFLKDA